MSVGPHITGIQAVGKSTVARVLAQCFERGVHIEADVLYQMTVTGRVLPEEPGVMPPEAERQLGLPFDLVVLAPGPEVDANERDPGRGKRVLGEKWAAYLDRELRAAMAETGIWIDNSDQSPEETVDEIVRRLEVEATA